MKKIKMIIVAAIAAVAIVGCTTTYQGTVAGSLLYKGYVKMAEKQGEAFTQKVQKVWNIVNAIETAEELSTAYQQISAGLDEIIADTKLKDWQKKVFTQVREMLDKAIVKQIDDKIETNKGAIEFLVAARAEIRKCIEKGARDL